MTVLDTTLTRQARILRRLREIATVTARTDTRDDLRHGLYGDADDLLDEWAAERNASRA